MVSSFTACYVHLVAEGEGGGLCGCVGEQRKPRSFGSIGCWVTLGTVWVHTVGALLARSRGQLSACGFHLQIPLLSLRHREGLGRSATSPQYQEMAVPHGPRRPKVRFPNLCSPSFLGFTILQPSMSQGCCVSASSIIIFV